MADKLLFGGESLAGTSRSAIPQGYEVLSKTEEIPFMYSGKTRNPATMGFQSRGYWDNTTKVTEVMEY